MVKESKTEKNESFAEVKTEVKTMIRSKSKVYNKFDIQIGKSLKECTELGQKIKAKI